MITNQFHHSRNWILRCLTVNLFWELIFFKQQGKIENSRIIFRFRSQPCLKWQVVKIIRLFNLTWPLFWRGVEIWTSSLWFSYSVMNSLKTRYDSIGTCIWDFLVVWLKWLHFHMHQCISSSLVETCPGSSELCLFFVRIFIRWCVGLVWTFSICIDKKSIKIIVIKFI